MNKVLLVGNLVRDPETYSTTSGIKYTRFTIAISRQFGEDQADFVPVVAWRQTAEFIEKYLTKGSKVSIEGRFSSSTYKNAKDETVTRYEVSADRVQSLESRAQREQRTRNGKEVKPSTDSIPQPTNTTHSSSVQKDEIAQTQDIPLDVPWELDL